MLSRSRRLRAAEVREVLSRGHSARAGALSAKYLKGPEPLRSAAVVSKKVAKSAVSRNRLRRALYRALAPLSSSGRLVLFVQKIPTAPLTPAFAADIADIIKQLTQTKHP